MLKNQILRFTKIKFF